MMDDYSLDPKWYVAHTYSGYENKVKDNIAKIVENRGLADVIVDVRIPVETVVEMDGEQQKESESKLFPSYVLVKMIMNDATWHVIRNIRGVTGFVGPGSRPSPLSAEEVAALNIEEKKVKLSYSVGDTVIVIGGLFEGYTGTVQSISDDSNKVTVLVNRGRRDMPVELDSGMIKLKENI